MTKKKYRVYGIGYKVSEKGFTLVEFLVASTITGVLLVVFTALFITLLEAHRANRAVGGLQIEGTLIAERLGYDIRRASAIVTPASPGSTTQNLVLTISGSSVEYNLSGTSLIRTDTQGAVIISDSYSTVESLAFVRNGTGSTGDTIEWTVALKADVKTLLVKGASGLRTLSP